MKINSIRFKTSVLFSSIICIVLLLFSVSLYHVARHIFYKDLDRDLAIKANQIVSIMNAYAQVTQMESDPLFVMQRFLSGRGASPLDRKIIDELWHSDAQALGLKHDYYRIVNSDMATVLHSPNYTKKSAALFDGALLPDFRSIAFFDIRHEAPPLRVVNYPIIFKHQVPFALQLATPLTSVDQILQQLLFAMILVVVGILLLTSFLGAILTASILKPVSSVIHAAETISHHDLGKRIDVRELDHEMHALIDSFNTMLGRLERSFAHISEFSSHVAHELKTPLTIIRGELELAVGEADLDAENTRVMQTTLEEIDHLIKIVKDLLLLSRLDYRPDVFNFAPIGVGDFMRDVFQHGEVLASEKRITLCLDDQSAGAQIQADAVHLRRLFFNVLHNAIKYTPENGTIAIALTSDEQSVHVAVSDNGCGISKENCRKLFDKFFRIKHENDATDYGAGLGLSIAQSIAKAHRGTITVTSVLDEGATFTCTLPRT